MTYLDGCIIAESKGYIIKDFICPLKSFSVAVDDLYAIAINRSALDPGEDKTVLFHELGHCETDSFYNEAFPLDVREKHENRADKWAIKKLVPKNELDDAIAEGCKEYWQLAERFGVTVDFIRKAVCWYTYGNLAVEQLL